MSSVSLGGGCSAALYSNLQSTRTGESNHAQQLFAKLDVNGDSSVDQSEMESFVGFIAERTGATVDAGSLLQSLDSDGDGSLSSTELGDGAQTLFDQLSAQLRETQLQSRPQPPAPEEMFSKIDTDGDGSISTSELESFTAQRADGNGPGAEDILARDDADGDGSISADEFATAMQHGPGGSPPEGGLERTLASLLQEYGAFTASTGSGAVSSILDVAA